MSFEGASVKALKQAFAEAMEDDLVTCVTIGKAPEKTYKGGFNVRVPSILHKQAAIFAAARNIPLNELIKKALRYVLLNQDAFSQSIADNTIKTGLS